MTVRREQRRDPKTNSRREILMVDFVYRFPDGRRERIRKVANGNTERQAEAEERALLRALADGTYRRGKEVKKEERMPTVEEFGRTFIELYARPNNKPTEVKGKQDALRLYINPAMGKKRLDQVNLLDIDRLKADLLGRGLSPKTVRNALTVLSRMLHYAVDVEILKLVPRIKLPKQTMPDMDFLDYEEAELLLATARQHYPEWYAPLLFTLRTGMRRGEVFEMRWGDVRLEGSNPHVRVARSLSWNRVTTPKNGKARTVPLSPQTVEVLKAHRHLRGDLVFGREDGKHMGERQSDYWLRRICRRAGLREIGWHCLRHTFASHLVMKGAPLKHVQELLGHSTIQMTLRYSHLAPAETREVVALLDDVSARFHGNGLATTRAASCTMEASTG